MRCLIYWIIELKSLDLVFVPLVSVVFEWGHVSTCLICLTRVALKASISRASAAQPLHDLCICIHSRLTLCLEHYNTDKVTQMMKSSKNIRGQSNLFSSRFPLTEPSLVRKDTELWFCLFNDVFQPCVGEKVCLALVELLLFSFCKFSVMFSICQSKFLSGLNQLHYN